MRTGIVLALAIHGAFPAAAAPSHTVQPGETLSEIAEAYNLSLETLASVNAITDVNHIAAGTPLLLPNGCGAVAPACAAALATATTYRALIYGSCHQPQGDARTPCDPCATGQPGGQTTAAGSAEN